MGCTCQELTELLEQEGYKDLMEALDRYQLLVEKFQSLIGGVASDRLSSVMGFRGRTLKIDVEETQRDLERELQDLVLLLLGVIFNKFHQAHGCIPRIGSGWDEELFAKIIPRIQPRTQGMLARLLRELAAKECDNDKQLQEMIVSP